MYSVEKKENTIFDLGKVQKNWVLKLFHIFFQFEKKIFQIKLGSIILKISFCKCQTVFSSLRKGFRKLFKFPYLF